jgi:hypothetical protein
MGVSIDPLDTDTIRQTSELPGLPRFGRVEQNYATDPLSPKELETAVRAALSTLQFDSLPPGSEIAVCVGSRGIANVAQIAASVVAGVESMGHDPFVIPAMGSHGGATAAGQREQLRALGVTEETIGCEIRATMDVVELGETDTGIPVVTDAHAATADGIVPINRIKPHTDFQGPVESGLSKMLVVGMGKQRGAKLVHDNAVDRSLRDVVPELAVRLLDELPVLGGVAVVENEREGTALVEGVPPSDFLDREAALLETAYELLPTLPFETLDVLVLDRIGKNISGAGMDTNVVGRLPYGIGEPAPETPSIKRIYLRDLTPESHGNAAGLGIADFVHRRVVEQMDYRSTAVNAISATTPRAIRVPPVVDSDRAGLLAALATVGRYDPETVRIARIRDTMRPGTLQVSSALVEEARARQNLVVRERPRPLSFDGDTLDTL